MSIDNINIEDVIASVRKSLKKDKDITPGLRASIEMMIVLIGLLVNKLGLNSKNSSIPPSKDLNREKKKKSTGKKPGGQKGRTGKTLKQTKTPDIVKNIPVDRKSLPKGSYKSIGFETRQVFDLNISIKVTEYRAEILKNEKGKKFTAPFPKGVTNNVQYGDNVKAHAVYLSQYQLLPYNRIEEYFSDQMGLPLSAGTVSNFNKKAFENLTNFEKSLKQQLINGNILHADETGINVNGTQHWLHGNTNEDWTYLFPHKKRGKEAMDAMGVLPEYQGALVHDHWKPYYKYHDIVHNLCNAHHLRELERAYEQDNQKWAKTLQELLLKMNDEVNKAGGKLNEKESDKWKKKFRKILKEANEECSPPKLPKGKPKRGRLKRSKARNLLERLCDYEADTLRFMDYVDIPFTNNLGERDIRMTKVQQKISGCFRSFDGAKCFCRIRSYISSARKQGFSASYALKSLFQGEDVFQGAE